MSRGRGGMGHGGRGFHGGRGGRGGRFFGGGRRFGGWNRGWTWPGYGYGYAVRPYAWQQNYAQVAAYLQYLQGLQAQGSVTTQAEVEELREAIAELSRTIAMLKGQLQGQPIAVQQPYVAPVPVVPVAPVGAAVGCASGACGLGGPAYGYPGYGFAG